MTGNFGDFRAIPLGRCWEAYQKAAVAQKAVQIAQPPGGVAAVSERGDFVCGVALYPTPWNTIIAEHLVTNPELPMWERHAGVIRIAHAARDHAICFNSDLWFAVRHPGLKRTLERAGYKSRGAEVFAPW